MTSTPACKHANSYNTPSEVECSLTIEEEDIEEICIEFANDEEEVLLKLKDKVSSELNDVSYEIGNNSTSFEYLEKYTKEILEKYPRHTMALNKILMKQEEEIKKLKNDITSQVEKNKKVDDELSKSLEDIKINVNLSTQPEETKRVEELLNNQVNEKEESCHKLEAKVVDLRKKVEKSNTHVNFMNTSTILNEILDSQRSPNDKSSLGHNKEDTHLEASTSKKHNVSYSFSKGGSKSASQVPHKERKLSNEQIKEDIKKSSLHPKENS
jgi:uncharacterized HAD superfamily protein